MSVVIYDGRNGKSIIGADRQVSAGDLKFEGTKMFKMTSNRVLAWTGNTAEALTVVEWYKTRLGSDRRPWPACQSDERRWVRLMVATPEGCEYYEQEPMPIKVPRGTFMAWGAGRDFAIGAMGAGANVESAILLTNRYNAWCGYGAEVYDLTDL